jgi:hypothetical protein
VAIENGASGGTAAAPDSIELKPQWPSVVARDAGTVPYPPSDLPVRNGTSVGAAETSADPGQAEAGHGAAAAANGVNGTGAPGGIAAFDAENGDEFDVTARSTLAERAERAVTLVRRLASQAWQQPLEATAIILLGLGGVIFPPVFVLGALVALGSKSWHYRDKWVGLVLPLVMTIIGIAAGVAVGGTSHGIHDGWVTLNIVSRVAAALGAGYLAWRTGAGRRPPPAPPWHKPHRAA